MKKINLLNLEFLKELGDASSRFMKISTDEKYTEAARMIAEGALILSEISPHDNGETVNK